MPDIEYRYLKLSEPTFGTWPAEMNIQPGLIIRLPINDPVPSDPVAWNEHTKGWAGANWLPTTDPRLRVSADSSNGDDCG
jgi:hypothetical protein